MLTRRCFTIARPRFKEALIEMQEKKLVSFQEELGETGYGDHGMIDGCSRSVVRVTCSFSYNHV